MKKKRQCLIILTEEQLLHLQRIVRDLLAGKTVQMNVQSEEDKKAGKKLLKALKGV